MATNRKNAAAAPKRLPTHNVYCVTERKDGQKNWNRIGAAWTHEKDGKGFTIRLDAFPLPFTGELTVRERKSNGEEGEGR